jgi:DNA-binding GntR family transcriptional regulator
MKKKENTSKKKNCQSLKQIAYEKISAMIIGGEFGPNMELSENPLSEKLGISRTPIREAFLQLEKEGLIEIIPRKGAFLRKITTKEIQELFQVREVVEGLAAYLAAGKFSNEDFLYIETLFDDANYSKDKNNRETKLEYAGDELHRLILEKCNNSKIVEILNKYKTLISLERRQAALIPVQIEEAYMDHMAILQALKEGAEKVEAAMRKHIRNTMASLLSSYY